MGEMGDRTLYVVAVEDALDDYSEGVLAWPTRAQAMDDSREGEPPDTITEYVPASDAAALRATVARLRLVAVAAGNVHVPYSGGRDSLREAIAALQPGDLSDLASEKTSEVKDG